MCRPTACIMAAFGTSLNVIGYLVSLGYVSYHSRQRHSGTQFFYSYIGKTNKTGKLYRIPQSPSSTKKEKKKAYTAFRTIQHGRAGTKRRSGAQTDAASKPEP